MADVIPRNIHFILLREEPQTVVVRTILQWVLQNPLYHVRVWVDAVCKEACLERIKEGCREFQYGDQEWHLRAEDHVSHTDLFIHTTIEGRFVVSVYVLNALVPLYDPVMLYEEMTTYDNRQSAVEVYRTWVLYEYGGIYLKPFCRPARKMLPPVITAPRGILLGRVLSEGEIRVDDYLMACPAKSQRIESLCAALHEDFEEQVPEWGHGARHLDKWEHLRLETFGVFKEWEERPPDATRIRKPCVQQMMKYYQHDMIADRTGVEKIREWLSKHEEVDVDTMRKVSFSGAPHSGFYYRGWLEDRPDVVSLYIFEDQTGYAPILDEDIKKTRIV